MLKTGYKCFKKVYLATGFTDLRCGVNALSAKIEYSFGHKPYDKDVLYLFCGKRNDRIKGLVWEGDGWLLLYKRLDDNNHFTWPRNSQEVLELSDKQYEWLMYGFSIYAKVNEVYEPPAHTL